MRTKITVVCSAIIALFPYASFADFDPTTFVQDQLITHQEQINTIIKKYTGKELDMQQLTNSPDKLKNLKKAGIKLAIGSATKYAPQMIIRTKVLKGISGKVKGNFATPELAAAVNNEMARNDQVNNDIQKARERRKKLNKLQVQNVSILYAKALVTRRSIINETEQLDEEEKQLKELIEDCSGSSSDGSDSGRCEGLIPILAKSYAQTVDRANARWRSILDFTANYYGQKASIDYMGVSISRADKDEQAAEDAAKKGQANSSNLASGLQSGNGANPLLDPNKGKDLFNKGKDVYGKVKNGNYGGALGEVGGVAGDYGLGQAGDYISKAGSTYDKGKNTVEDVKNGNYGGALSEVGGVAGDYGLGQAGDYISKAGSTYDKGRNTVEDVKNGNYGGALSEVGGVAGDYGLGQAGDYISKAGSTYDKGKNTVEDVKNGNYGGALSNVSGVAGDYGLKDASNYIDKAGSAYNAGKNAVNNVQSGNYGAAVGNVASGVTSAGGSYMDDKTKNIISGVEKGANASDNIIYNVGKGKWSAVAKGAESTYKDVKNTVKTEDKDKKKTEDKDKKKTETGSNATTNTNNGTKDGSDFKYPLTHENQPKTDNKDSGSNKDATSNSQVTPPLAPKDDGKNTGSSSNWNFSLWGNNAAGSSSKTPTWPNVGNN